MSSSNRLGQLHREVINRHHGLPRLIGNSSGSHDNVRLVHEAARAIEGAVGDLRMSDDDLRLAGSILCTVRHANTR